MGQRCYAHQFQSVTFFSCENEFVTILYVEGSNAQPFRHRSGYFAARISERMEVMCMILKLTAKQSAKVRKLARSRCCNCVGGNCLLLDDGEECKCVQLISRYGIYCNYFRKAVLPAEKELYDEILQQNNLR